MTCDLNMEYRYETCMSTRIGSQAEASGAAGTSSLSSADARILKLNRRALKSSQNGIVPDPRLDSRASLAGQGVYGIFSVHEFPLALAYDCCSKTVQSAPSSTNTFM
jgi:hypothetical protein